MYVYVYVYTAGRDLTARLMTSQHLHRGGFRRSGGLGLQRLLGGAGGAGIAKGLQGRRGCRGYRGLLQGFEGIAGGQGFQASHQPNPRSSPGSALAPPRRALRYVPEPYNPNPDPSP